MDALPGTKTALETAWTPSAHGSLWERTQGGRVGCLQEHSVWGGQEREASGDQGPFPRTGTRALGQTVRALRPFAGSGDP